MTDSYTFNTPIGFLTIREEEKKLTKLFWEANSVQTMKNELHSDFLYEVYTQVNEYLTGRRKQFDVPLKYQGTQFQQSVWQELQKIPYGETKMCIRDSFRCVCMLWKTGEAHGILG